MNLRLKAISILFVCSAAMFANASDPTDKYEFSYVNKSDMPNAMAFLPDPPQKGSFMYSNDSMVYKNDMKIRSTARGDTAYNDAVKTSIADYMSRFGAVMGLNLNEKDYPTLAQLMTGVIHDIRGSVSKAKKAYARHRPYQDFNEHTMVPEEESPTDFTSYPSGHTVRGWGLALLFVAIAPEYQEQILKVGYDIGESRVITGFHYPSDVEAARLAASAGFARLCAEPKFIEAMQKARAEIKKGLSKKSKK